MMKARVQRLRVFTEENNTTTHANMSRVVSVESPDSRDGFAAPAKTMAGYSRSTEVGMEEEGTSGSSVPVTLSPLDAFRMGMASPFRNFLRLLKPSPLPGSSLHGSEESPRASNMSATEIESMRSGSSGAEKDTGVEMSSSSSSSVASRLYETRGDGQSLVLVAFDANGKGVSHTGIVWAMEHVLKRGDVLAVVSVLDSVRGPLGYRVKIGDQKWLSANQKLVEEEIQQKLAVWRNFPGLDSRCEEGGVNLVVVVKAAQRSELAICKEAVRLGACHVVLDKSLKNRRREFYLRNFSCDVTRMRRSGGVDVIRPSLDMTTMMGLVQRNITLPQERRSPKSVIPPLLSYGDQIDEFEFSLGSLKPKRVNSHTPKSAPLPSPKYSGKHSSSAYSGSESNSAELRRSAYSGELRRLPSSAVLASAHDRSSSMNLLLSAHARSSSVSAAPTSSSNATDHDNDDDLFSIFHGSNRHTEIDTDIFRNINPPSTSGYESDDLFSIGNASTRRTSPAPPLECQPLIRPGHYPTPDLLRPNPRLSLDSPSSISEPLREATISRIAFLLGLGEAVTVTLHHPLRPGEGLLVGTSPSALFLLHSDHDATLSTAPPGSYVAMEGKMAMKLAFLQTDQRLLAVDSLGRCRSVPVRHATTTATPLVLVEAHCEGRHHSVTLHHSETLSLCPSHRHSHRPGELLSVKSLKVGHRVLLRLRSAEPSHAIWSS